METIKIKREFINNMAYLFIPLTHEVSNEGSKGKIKLNADTDKMIVIPKGEDIESSIYLKNKLGVLVELVD